jgi:hypothetical protein
LFTHKAESFSFVQLKNVSYKLSKKYIRQLAHLPESGMGYQIVDVKLNSDVVLKKRVVFNSTYLELERGDKFSNEDIKAITMHRTDAKPKLRIAEAD